MIKVLELFGGISAPQQSLNKLGIETETVDYVEFDSKVVAIRNLMYGSNYKPNSVVGYSTDKQVDLLIGGSPCQDFSTAGLGKGGEKDSGTRSSLIWEQMRILTETKPKYYIWENVKGVLNKNHIEIFNKHNEYVESIGYKVYYKVLNARNFGIPQNRDRVFVVAIRNDLDQEFNFDNLETKEMTPLKEFLNKNLETKELPNNFKEYTNFIVIPRASDGKLINGAYNRIWKDDKYVGTIAVKMSPFIKINNGYRKLTNIEKFYLMGFDHSSWLKIRHINDSNLNKVIGNSIVVDVLEAIFKELLGGGK